MTKNNQSPNPQQRTPQSSPQHPNNAQTESAEGHNPRPIVSQIHDNDQPRHEVDDKIEAEHDGTQGGPAEEAAAEQHANNANHNIAEGAKPATPTEPTPTPEQNATTLKQMVALAIYKMIAEDMPTGDAMKFMHQRVEGMNQIRRKQFKHDVQMHHQDVLNRADGALQTVKQNIHMLFE